MKPLYQEVNELLDKHGASMALRADIDALFNEDADPEKGDDAAKGDKGKGKGK